MSDQTPPVPEGGSRWTLYLATSGQRKGQRIVRGPDVPTGGVEVMPVVEYEAAMVEFREDEDSASAECSRLEADIYGLHAGLEDIGLPGAINAESIEERIGVLASERDRLREFVDNLIAGRYFGGGWADKIMAAAKEARRDA